MTPSPPLMLMWEGRNNMKIIRSEFQATRIPQSQKGICYLLLAPEYSVSGIRHELFTLIPKISHNMSSQRLTMEMKRLWRSGKGLEPLLDLMSWAGKATTNPLGKDLSMWRKKGTISRHILFLGPICYCLFLCKKAVNLETVHENLIKESMSFSWP